MLEEKIFQKPALSLSEQIHLLAKRNLLIDEVGVAEHYLSTIGYYRLLPYFKSFLRDHQNSDQGFCSNVKFSDVMKLYNFDRELRLLVVDALERVEIALRAAISNLMSLKYGAHWYMDSKFFVSQRWHASFINEACKSLDRSNEDFITNYYMIYHNPHHPPSWMMMECLSFGSTSKLYSNIKDRSIRKAIGDDFGVYSETLKSWLRALTFTRNVCAHHARLWNRFFINTPKNVDIGIKLERDKSPFLMQAYVITCLVAKVEPGSHWKQKFRLLLDEYERLLDFEKMGFVGNWKKSQIWDL